MSNDNKPDAKVCPECGAVLRRGAIFYGDGDRYACGTEYYPSSTVIEQSDRCKINVLQSENVKLKAENVELREVVGKLIHIVCKDHELGMMIEPHNPIERYTSAIIEHLSLNDKDTPNE